MCGCFIFLYKGFETLLSPEFSLVFKRGGETVPDFHRVFTFLRTNCFTEIALLLWLEVFIYMSLTVSEFRINSFRSVTFSRNLLRHLSMGRKPKFFLLK